MCTLKLSKSRLTVFNVYRPPPSYTKAVPFSQFLTDFQTLVSLAATTSHDFLITGDFNLHVDDNQNSQANQFLSVLDSSNLVQLVTFPTHRNGHTLDLIITTNDSSVSPKISYSRISPSDHFPIFSKLSIQPPALYFLLTEIPFRCFDAISIPHFVRDIFSSKFSPHPQFSSFSFRPCRLLQLHSQ